MPPNHFGAATAETAAPSEGLPEASPSEQRFGERIHIQSRGGMISCSCSARPGAACGGTDATTRVQPVQAPTKYKTLLNLKTAKALGITVPDIVLLRADEVIE